jgi:hypothetical protein
MITSPEIHPAIKVALAESPKDWPMQVVSRLHVANLISDADFEAWDALTKGGTKKIPKPKVERDDSEPRPKRAYVNRKARCETRPIGFHGRFIRRQSLAPTLDWRLSAGCVRTLNYVVARIGKKGIWSTWTVNIAKDLGYCVRTIRVHLRTLADAGYLWRSPPDANNHGQIKLAVLVAAEVPLFVPLKKGASPSSDKQIPGRNLDSATYEMNSLENKKERQEPPPESSRGTEPGNPGAVLVEAAPPLDIPLGVKGELTGSSSLDEETPRHGKTVAGHSAEPMRDSDPERAAFKRYLEEMIRKVGLSPSNRPGRGVVARGARQAPVSHAGADPGS